MAAKQFTADKRGGEWQVILNDVFSIGKIVVDAKVGDSKFAPAQGTSFSADEMRSIASLVQNWTDSI